MSMIWPNHVRRSTSRSGGQVLVLFALILVGLLGLSALAVDYGGWLLEDRALQNAADSAALTGAAEFAQFTTDKSCVSSTAPMCSEARVRAWASLKTSLRLCSDLADPITCESAISTFQGRDSPPAGDTIDGHTIWVDTPPGGAGAAYSEVGGRYAGNVAVVFVRVDHTVDAYIGHMLMPNGSRRTGWATAGPTSADLALSVYCYDDSPLQTGACKSDGLGINGGGGITVSNGDIGSNESLKVTQQGGQGVIVSPGNMYVVDGACGQNSWNCPPTRLGGIQDGSVAVPNLYMPRMYVPLYPSPLEGTASICNGTSDCVPYRPYSNGSPGDWGCGPTWPIPCGTWDVTNNQCIVPNAHDGVPFLDLPGATEVSGSPTTTGLFNNIDEEVPDNSDYVYGGDDQQFTYEVQLNNVPSGITTTAGMAVLVNVAKFHGGTAVSTEPNNAKTVGLTVSLWQNGAQIWSDSTTIKNNNPGWNQVGFSVRQSNGNPYSLQDPTVYPLSLKFEAAPSGGTSGSTGTARGVGISFARLQLPGPPKVGPGYWRSITVDQDGGCAILDPNPPGSPAGTPYPSAATTGLELGQRPGIFRLQGQSNGAPAINLATNAALFGDRVTIVADKDFQVSWGSNSALILNVTSGIERQAAWAVQGSATPTGTMAWPRCETNVPDKVTHCVETASYDASIYDPPANYRGITLYFPPVLDGSGHITIADRFTMGSSSGGTSPSLPGIQFQGVFYAPYDNVKITSDAVTTTIGTVLAWTAVFDGQANIQVDYPYQRMVGPPYLLEPSLGQP